MSKNQNWYLSKFILEMTQKCEHMLGAEVGVEYIYARRVLLSFSPLVKLLWHRIILTAPWALIGPQLA